MSRPGSGSMLRLGWEAVLLLLSAVPAGAFPSHWQPIDQWVQDRGYPFEVHNATTEDGVLLALFRLPRAGAPVVLLQHGVLDSAWGWVFNKAFPALAFQVYDAGYDVWLGNNRGNDFSQRWANGTDATESREFWNFSYDEMARQDLPALIGKVLTLSKKEKLAYVAHSQGTMQFFIAASLPELKESVADRVELFVALSPVAWLGHVRSELVRILANLKILRTPVSLLFPEGFLTRSTWRFCEQALCEVSLGALCKVSIAVICGTSEFDTGSNVEQFGAHFPFGTSIKNMLHFAQGLHSGKFRRYDYGSTWENVAHYGHAEPPEYNLSSMTVPTALFLAADDLLADTSDVRHLGEVLRPTGIVHEAKLFPGFSHATWLLGSARAGYYTKEVLATLASRAMRANRSTLLAV